MRAAIQPGAGHTSYPEAGSLMAVVGGLTVAEGS